MPSLAQYLTIELSDRIESIQKHAFKIVCSSSISDYEQLRILYNLPSLFERLKTSCERFSFKFVLSSTNCLHHLSPSCKTLIAKLWHADVYATPTVRTHRFRNVCPGQIMSIFRVYLYLITLLLLC